MKYSRAALRRGAPRPQNAEANSPRGRQARASADKADPRRDIGGQKSPSPRHGGQGRPAPRSAAAAPARPHAYYISPFTLCQAPFFGFISRAFPDLPRPFMAFPALLRLSTPRFPLPVLPRGRAGAAAGGQNGCGGAGAAERARLPPQGAAERTERLLQGLPRQKSGGSPYGLPPCLISVVQRGRAMRPAAGAAASDLSRPAAARGADSVPKQTRKKPRRRGTGRTVGNARRGNNAAARRSDAVSPPLLPQSAGAQTRRASAYT